MYTGSYWSSRPLFTPATILKAESILSLKIQSPLLMAGNFGAHKFPLLFKLPNPSFCLTSISNPIFLSSCRRLSCRIKMAENGDKTQSPEIKEPSPKLRKLHQHQNGVGPASALSFFKVKKLSDKAVLPSRASPFSAGYDLSSAVETKVPARGKALIATDLSIAIPEGTYARIAPRSGLAWKHAIDVGAGVIDADYRGAVGVILFNHSDVDFEVKVGDRIAQLIIQQVMTPEVFEVEDLESTARGGGGFGSTGI